MDRFTFTSRFDLRFKSGEPFFFLINYDLTAFTLIPFAELIAKSPNNHCNHIKWKLPHYLLKDAPWSSAVDALFNEPPARLLTPVTFIKHPINFAEYQNQFNQVQAEIRSGNTYLLNLTASTPIETNLSLKTIYTHASQALLNNFLLYYEAGDHTFVSFSPETFVTIKKNLIFANPMKGTYLRHSDATQATLDPKELYEQTTVVDRVRNDLSLISDHVRVTGFLTPQAVITHTGTIYQTISTVQGELSDTFYRSPGAGLLSLLPAASITGAPKEKTVEIIKHVETHERRYYTGIWGVVAKGELYSAVIIRHLEEQKKAQSEQKYYKSGGGITFMSQAQNEYDELLAKIYLPFKWKKM